MARASTRGWVRGRIGWSWTAQPSTAVAGVLRCRKGGSGAVETECLVNKFNSIQFMNPDFVQLSISFELVSPAYQFTSIRWPQID
jgi:hypothetical protein